MADATLVRAKYSYEPKNPDELGFKANDEIVLLEKKDNGWWKGQTNNGKVGLFPYNYVEVLPPKLPTPRATELSVPVVRTPDDGKERAIALEDYVGKDGQQLDFKKNDVILVIQKFPTGWWKGALERDLSKEGVFPQKTVKLVDSSNRKSDEGSESKPRSRSRSVSGDKRDKHKDRASSRRSRTRSVVPGALSLPSGDDQNTDSDPSDDEQPDSTNFGFLQDSPKPSARSGSEQTYMRCIEPVQSSGPGFLSLNRGDLVKVIDRKGDEFWTGEVNRAVGLFPIDACEEVPADYVPSRGSMAIRPPSVKMPNGALSMERPADGAPRSTGVALYNYLAQSDTQLSLTKDEKVTILKKLESGWWMGENALGKVGHFPASYVRETDENQPSLVRSHSSDSVHTRSMSSLPIKAKAVALHKYAGKDDTYLSFEINDEITVVGKSESGWWSGLLKGKVGHFPASYVREVGPADASGDGGEPAERKATALYAYTAQSSGELSLKAGDEVIVFSPEPDARGWFTGALASKRTVIGHFPASYVKIEGGGKPKKRKESRSTSDLPSVPISSIKTTPKEKKAFRQTSKDSMDETNKSDKSPNTSSSSLPDYDDGNSDMTSPRPSKPLPPLPPGSAAVPEKSLPPVPPAGSRMSLTLPTLPPPSAPSVASVVASLGGNSNGNPAPVKRPGTVSFVRPPGDDTPKPGTPPPTSSPAIDNEKVKEQEKSIEQLKTALVRLQQQTKGAMEDMVQKIEAQSKERLKLEYVMRDMKYTLKEEKEARQRLEQQNRALYNEIQVLKQRDASDDQDDEFSGMSAGELRNQVRYVTSHLAQETRSRQDLVSLVQRLQGDLESVQRQLRRDNSSVNGGHVYGK